MSSPAVDLELERAAWRERRDRELEARPPTVASLERPTRPVYVAVQTGPRRWWYQVDDEMTIIRKLDDDEVDRLESAFCPTCRAILQRRTEAL